MRGPARRSALTPLKQPRARRSRQGTDPTGSLLLPLRGRLCATNALKEVRCRAGDEGRPLGAGCQEQAPNHRKLRRSRAVVVNVAEKAGRDPVRYGSERRAQAEITYRVDHHLNLSLT